MTVKIATWNLERPKQPKTRSEKNRLLLDRLKEQDADIFVLTETNTCIDLGPEYEGFPSDELQQCKECDYTAGENRTTVWVKKKFPTKRLDTSDPATSVCVRVTTDDAELLVYGTVIGILGHPSQNVDAQMKDWRRVSESGKLNICIAGDFNVQYGEPNQFTDVTKEKIVACFNELEVTNLTAGIAGNIDHIAISNRVIAEGIRCEPHLWNLEKRSHIPVLSDHIGVAVLLKANSKF